MEGEGHEETHPVDGGGEVQGPQPYLNHPAGRSRQGGFPETAAQTKEGPQIPHGPEPARETPGEEGGQAGE